MLMLLSLVFEIQPPCSPWDGMTNEFSHSTFTPLFRTKTLTTRVILWNLFLLDLMGGEE